MKHTFIIVLLVTAAAIFDIFVSKAINFLHYYFIFIIFFFLKGPRSLLLFITLAMLVLV